MWPLLNLCAKIHLAIYYSYRHNERYLDDVSHQWQRLPEAPGGIDSPVIVPALSEAVVNSSGSILDGQYNNRIYGLMAFRLYNQTFFPRVTILCILWDSSFRLEKNGIVNLIALVRHAIVHTQTIEQRVVENFCIARYRAVESRFKPVRPGAWPSVW